MVFNLLNLVYFDIVLTSLDCRWNGKMAMVNIIPYVLLYLKKKYNTKVLCEWTNLTQGFIIS